MPKSPNQKLKLLYLMQMLLEKTDESHPLSMEQIIQSLAANGVSAERKSIYDDIESLRLYGLDIGMTKSKRGAIILYILKPPIVYLMAYLHHIIGEVRPALRVMDMVPHIEPIAAGIFRIHLCYSFLPYMYCYHMEDKLVFSNML